MGSVIHYSWFRLVCRRIRWHIRRQIRRQIRQQIRWQIRQQLRWRAATGCVSCFYYSFSHECVDVF